MNYWLKQTSQQPLFPELEWSKPENRMHAGKVLIAGGNLHGFSAPATAFAAAEKAGIGTIRVLLPDAIRKTVSSFMPEADFAPSTPSGSFASPSLDNFLEHATWADGVLLAGDLGRNSETAIVLEKFSAKYSGLLFVTKDATDYFTTNPTPVLQRVCTVLVMSMSQLQRLVIAAKFSKAVTLDMDLLRLIELLHQFTSEYKLTIVVKHHDRLVAALGGQVSTTKLEPDPEIWRVEYASKIAVWAIQHPNKLFESVTTSLI